MLFFLSNTLFSQSIDNKVIVDTVDVKFFQKLKSILLTSKASANKMNTLIDEKDKAVIIINITKFVQWPKEDDHIVIGLYKSNPFDGELKKNLKETYFGKDWILVQYANLEQLSHTKCNLLYIPNKHKSEVDNIVQTTSAMSILTIADDIGDFCKKKGIINIRKDNDKSRFQINLKKAKKEGLFISSKLLDMADIIE